MFSWWRAETGIFLGLWLLLMFAGRDRLFRDPGTFWHTQPARSCSKPARSCVRIGAPSRCSASRGCRTSGSGSACWQRCRASRLGHSAARHRDRARDALHLAGPSLPAGWAALVADHRDHCDHPLGQHVALPRSASPGDYCLPRPDVRLALRPRGRPDRSVATLLARAGVRTLVEPARRRHRRLDDPAARRALAGSAIGSWAGHRPWRTGVLSRPSLCYLCCASCAARSRIPTGWSCRRNRSHHATAPRRHDSGTLRR